MTDQTPSDAPPVVISASIAFDYIMAFGGSFADHIIPDKTHVISVSFLVDTLRKQRGGCGGNVAYSLALLGTPSSLVGAVGHDFAPYRAVMDRLGVDLSNVIQDDDQATATAFMMADRKDNQINSFYPGPSDRAVEVDVTGLGNGATYGLVGPTGPDVMCRHVAQLGSASCKLIYDPAFQIIILTAEQLVAGIDAAWGLVANDYEYAMLEKKTGLTIDQLEERVELLVITYGDQGSELRRNGERVKAPAAPATVVNDPSGAGDAYRSGLIKGLLLNHELPIIGRLAGLTATYVVEQIGTQEHSYTPEEFVHRFDASFPDYAGCLEPAELTRAQ
jgi:adenosine kinase